jgi:hypothetical protein
MLVIVMNLFAPSQSFNILNGQACVGKEIDNWTFIYIYLLKVSIYKGFALSHLI